MNGAAQYQRGPALRVRIIGHSEPVDMVSIEKPGFAAGGGLMLVIDRGDGEIERAIEALNADADQA